MIEQSKREETENEGILRVLKEQRDKDNRLSAIWDELTFEDKDETPP